MRRVILAFSLAVLVTSALAQEAALEAYRRAQALYSEGKYVESADAYAACIEAGAQRAATYYNAACSSALAGRVDAAFRWLGESIERGWRDVDHLRADRDLQSLHTDARWESAMAKCVEAREAFLKTLKHPDLYLELMEMKRVDQEFRSMAHLVIVDEEAADPAHEPAHGQEHAHGHEHQHESAHSAHGLDVDAKHTARMRQIVAEYGWPTKTLVGEEGATAAWLLVQHADADPKFQRHCLELMKKVPEGEVSSVDLAYLTDRVLVNEGKKQLYGTQFWVQDGKRVPRPIEDEAHLDERRLAAGMQPFAEYATHMQGLHDH